MGENVKTDRTNPGTLPPALSSTPQLEKKGSISKSEWNYPLFRRNRRNPQAQTSGEGKIDEVISIATRADRKAKKLGPAPTLSVTQLDNVSEELHVRVDAADSFGRLFCKQGLIEEEHTLEYLELGHLAD
jgi:hypothetical protein